MVIGLPLNDIILIESNGMDRNLYALWRIGSGFMVRYTSMYTRIRDLYLTLSPKIMVSQLGRGYLNNMTNQKYT